MLLVGRRRLDVVALMAVREERDQSQGCCSTDGPESPLELAHKDTQCAILKHYILRAHPWPHRKRNIKYQSAGHSMAGLGLLARLHLLLKATRKNK